MGCSEKAYFPIVEFIEWIMGDPENDFDYEIVEAQEMQDMYGNMNTGLNVMKIREDVYIGAINGNWAVEMIIQFRTPSSILTLYFEVDLSSEIAHLHKHWSLLYVFLFRR